MIWPDDAAKSVVMQEPLIYAWVQNYKQWQKAPIFPEWMVIESMSAIRSYTLSWLDRFELAVQRETPVFNTAHKHTDTNRHEVLANSPSAQTTIAWLISLSKVLIDVWTWATVWLDTKQSFHLLCRNHGLRCLQHYIPQRVSSWLAKRPRTLAMTHLPEKQPI